MAFINIMRASIGTIFLFLASGSAAQKSPGVTALLVQVDGQVTISLPSKTFPLVRPAAQYQVIRRGEVVHLPARAEVTLLCSTERLVILKGPQDWVLNEGTCRPDGPGVPIVKGSYQKLAAFTGRIVLSKDGFPVLENDTREVRPGFGPFLLSPLDTVVTDTRPRLVFTQVPDAREYELEIRGAANMSVRLPADDLHCGPGSGPWRGLDVCSWAPSDKWPALEPGKPLLLKFGSRQSMTAPLRKAQDVYKIQLLPGDEQRSVQEDLRQIAALPVDTASRLLLTAGTYAQRGLYADAIVNYDAVLQAQEIPEARVTLGDLYLTAGLTASAEREYRRVLAGTPGSAAQAAAELGLGQVAYIRKLFDDARAHFERARDLYAKLGLSAEAEKARVAAESLRPHTGNDSP
jgi:hypothetical protein